MYAAWTSQEGATQYMIAYNNVTFVTNQTFYTVGGVEQGQHYDITVTAFNNASSSINSFTCSGETGECHNRQIMRTFYLTLPFHITVLRQNG